MTIVSISARRRAAVPLTGLAIIFLACAWADGGQQTSPAPPASSQAPDRSQEPKYLIFWSEPEKAGELAERIGV